MFEDEISKNDFLHILTTYIYVHGWQKVVQYN